MYNLLDEQWIPVLYHNSKWGLIGIKQTFEEAHLIRQIASNNPMDCISILRFLLALLYWCKGIPPDNISESAGFSFPPDWLSKLDNNRDYFNVIGTGKRFYQYDEESVEGKEIKTSNYLLQEIPTGNNFWHTRHSTDYENGLCLPCCSRGLLRVPAFSTSGGRGLSPGINAKPPIYAVPVGKSLAETLILSWEPHRLSDLGTPSWVDPSIALPNSGDVPLLLGLTWLPRMIRLHEPEKTKSPCISCGKNEYLINKCVFVGVGSTKNANDTEKRTWIDPHVFSLRDSKKGVSTLRAGNTLTSHDSNVTQWRNTVLGILEYYKLKKAGDENTNITQKLTGQRVYIVSFASMENAKYLEATEEVFSVNLSIDYDAAITELTEWSKTTKKIPAKINKATQITRKDGSSFLNAVVCTISPQIEKQVLEKVHDLFSNTEQAYSRALEEYAFMTGMLSKSLFPNHTTADMQNRYNIGNVIQKMKAECTGKDRHAEGSGK